jgi:hypothetical protein
MTQVPDDVCSGVQAGCGGPGTVDEPGGAEYPLLPGQARVMAALPSGQDAGPTVSTQKVRVQVYLLKVSFSASSITLRKLFCGINKTAEPCLQILQVAHGT